MEILQLISPEVIQALGWTIIHSIWQSSLIGLLLFALLPLLKTSDANTRYHLSFGALLLVFAAGLSTFLYYLKQVPATPLEFVFTSEEFPLADTENFVIANPGILEIIQNNLHLISLLWMTGMILYFAKFGIGLARIQRFKRYAVSDPGHDVSELFRQINRKFGLSQIVQLKFSTDFTGPFISGWLKPVIYFPVNLSCQLTNDQIQDILAHEIAHIKRHDYLMNLIQVTIENLFYYHPVVWWISSQVRKEREMACDEYALKISGYNRIHYANTLLSLGNIYAKRSPKLGLSAKGFKNDLFNRISSLLGENRMTNQMREKVIASIVLLGVTIVALSFKSPNEIVEAIINTPDSDNIEVVEYVVLDTIPGENEVIRESHSRVIEMKNGKITKLEIDGEEIPEENYDEYDVIIKEMKSGNVGGDPASLRYHFYSGPEGLRIIHMDSLHQFELKGLEGITRLKKLEHLKGLEKVEGLARIEGLKSLERLEGLAELEHLEHSGHIGHIPDKYFSFDSDSFPHHYFRFNMDSIPKGIYRFDMDSMRGMMYHFDFDKLHEGLDWTESQLEEFYEKSKNQYQQFMEKNEFFKSDEWTHAYEDAMRRYEEFMEKQEWPEGETFRLKIESLEDEFFSKEEQERIGKELEEQLKHLEEQGLLLKDEFRYHFDEVLPSPRWNYEYHYDLPHEPFFYSNSFEERVFNQLNKDGYIKEGLNTIIITGKSMKVNGKRVDDATYEKYKKLYERQLGGEMDKNSKIKMKRYFNKDKRSESI